ncbi:hypothetical protein AU490_03860 [Lonsdalea populi]|uniref:Uncharacterized protein n=3 Tax=Lonsdalea TaxID=1082702 RepID=A0ACD1JD99_9GAMM|nr:hypothetical protein AU508_12370 [Lonsdalea populi]RAT13938.1 hypothetical protein AU485_07350 [Lonsdalea quercina]OSN01970.1 hypothetical protein AU499_03490 [Lonsdalea populi]RAT15514.1 hypothetical protein AU486_09980 [Lonsdalea quercina]RAT21935.1 hypothetical protein AU489_13835 [Lonsdalea populi]
MHLPLVFRALTVKTTSHLPGPFQRIVFTGDDLDGFNSPGFDDHVKLFFPDRITGELHLPENGPDGPIWGDVRPANREYTPLKFDAAARELTIDFYLHADGVASEWARAAKAGDALGMGGPRGSIQIPADYAWQLLICDETGIPALLRRLQELPDTTRGAVFIESEENQARPSIPVKSGMTLEWIMRDGNDDAQQFIAAVDRLSIPSDDYFVWATGENHKVLALKTYLTHALGLDEDYVRAVAYWKRAAK